MFEGLHALLVTSSRDWGKYRVDAWLWAVLVGWDCNDQHEHDEMCDASAAMTEMQQRHGWSDAAVSKARRYHAAVRAVLDGQTASGTATHRLTTTNRRGANACSSTTTTPPKGSAAS
ncbi:hypothetical protein ACFXJ6_21070 [Streptomyces sp. NPDC059218]|uniref:hypothetical protein n=1 Tax=unclassified Streptomyces TaxID=2593676 RepID=UPI0036781680